MTRSMIDILKEQVSELNKLLELKEKRIQELECIASMRPTKIYLPFISPVDAQTCNHEYPSPWFDTAPPACKKCGQPGNLTTAITYSRGEAE